MKIGRFIRRALSATVPPALFLSLTTYFGWEATQGDHGLKAYHEELLKLDEAHEAQQNAMVEQDIWRRRVAGLKEGALDPDLLDERARAMLNLSRKNEIVVPYDRHHQLY
ncbi:septum formation initiator family protein [Acetobacter sp. AN02]|uniref:FtsB family cell division protein n=1 Tax=Acetobacter sp. AN02 TaxID=2894186 RepID=UPI0024342DC0|nr:septum formation initiator family protein [Acetobacter sp. AN02]MDG6093617.1 septum formation initiator family protein [Acetobacter sp. AN02]